MLFHCCSFGCLSWTFFAVPLLVNASPCPAAACLRRELLFLCWGLPCFAVAVLRFATPLHVVTVPVHAAPWLFGSMPFQCYSEQRSAIAVPVMALPLLRKDVLCPGNARIAVPSLASSVRNSAALAHLRRTYASPWYALPLLCRAQHCRCFAERSITAALPNLA